MPFPPAEGREGELVRFGGASGIDVVELSLRPENAERIAGYLGKYAVKAVAAGLERRIKSHDQLAKLRLPVHLRTMVETAWYLGGDPALAGLELRRWAHQLGHPGRVLTYSRYWSTSFGALRHARRSWRRDHLWEDDKQLSADDAWRFIGIGYDSPGASELAWALAELDRDSRRSRARRAPLVEAIEVRP